MRQELRLERQEFLAYDFPGHIAQLDDLGGKLKGTGG